MSRAILFRKDFEPVVNIGDVIKILGLEKTKDKFYEVTWIEPAPMVIKDFGALTSGDESGNALVDGLKLDDSELGQWRLTIVDNIYIKSLRIGGINKIPLWSTKNSRGYPDRTIEYLNMLEFWTFEDIDVYMNVVAKEDLATSEVMFYGFIYSVEEYPHRPDVYTRIPVGVRPTQSKLVER